MAKGNAGPQLVTFAEADKALKGALSRAFAGRAKLVLLVTGNWKVDKDLHRVLEQKEFKGVGLVAVQGDLVVKGRIALYESYPGLWVGGKTTADTLEGGDCEIYIDEGVFKYCVYGYYNDGTLETGEIKTPWVINSNHDLRVSCDDAYWVDNYGDDDEYDFTERNIREAFVSTVLDKDGEDEIDVKKLIAHLAAKKPVLKKGAKTVTEASLAAVHTAAKSKGKDKRVYELDLTDKKLRAFPKEVLKMTWLKKLVLDDNEIKEIPEAIGNLVDLEELSVASCELKKLPAAIGKLKKLRVLRVGSNMASKAIVLPSSIGDLASLEVLDVSFLSDKPSGAKEPLPELTTYALPAAIGKLKKLRRIVAHNTNLAIPKSLEGSTSLEEIEMPGMSWAYLKRFPTFVTKFSNLKKLDVSGNFFDSVPDLGELKSLEELSLTNALGFVKKLPDLSKLPKLRVLHMSGNTGHTGVRKPLSAVLKQLFKMKLPALEELSIDRWGLEKGHRPALTPDVLEGIGRFKALKILDIEFNGLQTMPADFYTLEHIAEVKVSYNTFGAAEQKRMKKAFPKAKIAFESQR